MAPPDHSRRYDTRRKRRQPVEPASDEASEQDEVEDPQSRASHQPKKPLKHQKPAHITFEINGHVTINTVSGEFGLGNEERHDQRRRPSPPPTRRSTGRLQASKRRATPQCDSQSDSVTDSEDDLSSPSDNSAPQNHKSRRVTKSKASSERPQTQPGRRKKRYQPDEGYHTGSTAPYGEQLAKQSEKGKGRASSSKSRGDAVSHARLSSSAKPKESKSRVVESESERTDSHSGQDDSGVSTSDEDGSNEGNDDNEEEDASDDDFGKLPVQVSSKDYSKSIEEKAVLDTGTKPDWISATFYDKLKSEGIPVEKVRLSPEEQKIKYTDFNNKKFSPTSKVELMVQSDEFTGSMKCRNLSFFVASKATFAILIGRDTIRKQKIMTRGKPDPDGEGVFVGVHGEILEDEKVVTKKKKEDRDKVKEERKKKREVKMEETVKPKTKAKTSSNQVAAHLAATVSRRRRPGSPQRGGKDPPKCLETESDSSLEEACW